MEALYSGHPWDRYNCPDYRGVLISEVNLYYEPQFRTFVSVLNTGCLHFKVSLIEGFNCIRNTLLNVGLGDYKWLWLYTKVNVVIMYK